MRTSAIGFGLAVIGLAAAPGALALPATVAETTAPVAVAQPETIPNGFVSGDPVLGSDGTAFYPAATSPADNPHDAVFALRHAGGDWEGPLRVAPAGTHLGDLVGDVDGSGRLWLVWSRLGAADPDQGVWVMSIGPDGTRSAKRQLSTSRSPWYDLSVNDAGDVAVIWGQFESADVPSGTHARYRSADGPWEGRVRVGALGEGAHPQVEMLPEGDAIAMWSEELAEPGVDQNHLGRVYDAESAAWGEPMALGTAPRSDFERLDLAVSDTGNAVFSWPGGGRFLSADTGLAAVAEPELASYPHAFAVADDGTVRRFRAPGGGEDVVTERVRTPQGTWSDPTTVSDDGTASSPDVAVDGHGTIWLTVATVGFFPGGEHGPGRRVLREDPGGEFADLGMVPGRGEPYVDNLAVAPAGDALVVGAYPAWPIGPTTQVHATAFDVTGPVVVPRPLSTWTLTRTTTLRWTATDVWSLPGSSYDVARTSAAPTGDEDDDGVVGTTGARRLTVVVPRGRTACFGVTGTDGVGHLGDPSVARCTASPVDDRVLAASQGWQKVSADHFYRGTALLTARKGAWLRLDVTARRLALGASTCPSCGKVEVSLDGHRLARVSLRSTRSRHRVVLPVATLNDVRSGRLEIRVTDPRDRVMIDGVGVSRH